MTDADKLNEEVKRYYSDNFEYLSSDQPTLSILTNIARHFAEWGYLRAAEKYNEIEYNRQRAEESVPNDLEEAAKDYSCSYKPLFPPSEKRGRLLGFIAGAKWQEKKDQEIIKLAEDHAFLAGADWQKEKMLKEAVEISYKGGTARINGEEKPFEGGTVRIIIVKEDEK